MKTAIRQTSHEYLRHSQSLPLSMFSYGTSSASSSYLSYNIIAISFIAVRLFQNYCGKYFTGNANKCDLDAISTIFAVLAIFTIIKWKR